MNFSPFGGHFPTSIPMHQYTATKFSHESNGAVNGISSQNVSVMTEEPLVNSENRYSTHYNQHPIHVKYQRDSSTQIGGGVVPVSSPAPQPTENIHHYAVYNHSAQDDLKRPQFHENMLSQDIKAEDKEENGQNDYSSLSQHQQQQPGMPPTWQSIATPGSTVADYLSHLPASTLPISLHHFLKYSTETTSNKRDVETSMDSPLDQSQPQQHEHHNHIHQEETQSDPMSPSKRRKKKKTVKEKKPRPKPGEIRLTTALDGSTLYCCPECHMAYPDKGLLEQHLLGHTMERRFFCDICGAGLKRKDHLTRHKQSHNPDRPFVCTVCMKAFKRKEQLTLHFVIHSGEKRHVCTECGKGFYRKDHLRKHTRSHIARRVKAEMSQHVPSQSSRGDHS